MNYPDKIRKYAGEVMSKKTGDGIRNSVASALVDIARALEQLEKPFFTVKNYCAISALAGGLIGAVVVAVFFILL